MEDCRPSTLWLNPDDPSCGSIYRQIKALLENIRAGLLKIRSGKTSNSWFMQAIEMQRLGLQRSQPAQAVPLLANGHYKGHIWVALNSHWLSGKGCR
jgi:hypothetical protein